MKKDFGMILFWFCLVAVCIAYAKIVYGELLQDRPTDENIGIHGNHWWVDMRGKGLKEWKLEDHIKPEVKKVISTAAKNPIVKELPKETVAPKDFDIKKLAYAVAVAETGDCTKGYGKTHSNCHGIKKGNTYPCMTRPGSKMCVFKDKAESYKAFEIIWMKWYKTFPTHRQAVIWSGNDSSNTWLKHVKIAYAK